MASRCLTYRIVKRPDGRFDIAATCTTGSTVDRRNLATPAAVKDALDLLSAILDAQNLHLLQAGGPALD